MYADDTQLNLSTKTTKVEDVVSARTRVEVCLRELNHWMPLNNLPLNNGKTELLFLHAKHRPKQPLDSITVGDATVETTSSARNIDIVFDDTMTFKEQVNELHAGLLSFAPETLVAYVHALVLALPKH